MAKTSKRTISESQFAPISESEIGHLKYFVNMYFANESWPIIYSKLWATSTYGLYAISYGQQMLAISTFCPISATC